MSRKKIFVWLLATIVLGLAYLCFPTLRGLSIQYIAVWEEDAYIGKPLRDLEEMLMQRGIRLHSVHEGRVYPATHPGLKPNHKALEFTKGKSYPWIPIGSAVNVGYVIVEKTPNEQIVRDIIRSRSVDSL